MQNLRAVQRKGEHIGVVDALEPQRPGHKPGVGSIYSVDIGVDLAAIGVQCRRELDGSRVRAAAAESRCVAVFSEALKTRNDDDASGAELTQYASGVDIRYARLPVNAVRAYPRLSAAE